MAEKTKLNVILHAAENGIENENIILLPETRPQKASDINSENAAAGKVLTSTGNGKAKWDNINYPLIDVKVNGSSVVADKVANVHVPVAVSELENDSEYITGINWGEIQGTIENQTDVISAIEERVVPKQDKLTAGDYIQITEDNVISATGYKTAEENVLGLVKLGSDLQQTTSTTAVSAVADRTYAIQLNANEQAVVNVPWRDYEVADDSEIRDLFR